MRRSAHARTMTAEFKDEPRTSHLPGSRHRRLRHRPRGARAGVGGVRERGHAPHGGEPPRDPRRGDLPPQRGAREGGRRRAHAATAASPTPRSGTRTTWSRRASSATTTPPASTPSTGCGGPATSARTIVWNAGETIAWSAGSYATPRAVMKAWMERHHAAPHHPGPGLQGHRRGRHAGRARRARAGRLAGRDLHGRLRLADLRAQAPHLPAPCVQAPPPGRPPGHAIQVPRAQRPTRIRRLARRLRSRSSPAT